jgi:hypothetical protein
MHERVLRQEAPFTSHIRPPIPWTAKPGTDAKLAARQASPVRHSADDDDRAHLMSTSPTRMGGGGAGRKSRALINGVLPSPHNRRVH